MSIAKMFGLPVAAGVGAQAAWVGFYALLRAVVQPVPGGEGASALKAVYVFGALIVLIASAIISGCWLSDTALPERKLERDALAARRLALKRAIDEEIGIPRIG